MRILFACGGTAGHINPALAVARFAQEQNASSGILFAGAVGGMETDLVAREGFAIRTVEVRRLRHKITPAAFIHNAGVAWQLRSAMWAARQIITDFAPDVVLGMGGYASYPIVRQAKKMGIPAAIHESNAAPGFTTKMLARHVDCVMVSFEDSVRQYPRSRGVVVTGTPVRGSLLGEDRRQARTTLGISDKPLIVSFFGSLGARDMNAKMLEFLSLSIKDGKFAHIHAAGKGGYAQFLERAEALGLTKESHIQIREYIHDMPQVLAAADLLITRAGASTLAEICALQKSAILVPSPNVAGGHQEKNARVLENHGAALVFLEKDCTGKSLYAASGELLRNEENLSRMRSSLRSLGLLDATERIYRILSELTEK